MGLLGRYATVLAPSGIKSAFIASMLGRLPMAMNSLAILLLVRQTSGSYAVGGAVSATYAIALSVLGPLRARSADRRGPIPIMRLAALLHPLTFVLFALVAHTDADGLVLGACAALIGVTVPPIGSVMRAMWAARLDEKQLASAYSMESVFVEVNFVLGPILVTVINATANPTAAFISGGAIETVALLWMVTNPIMRAIEPHPERVSSFLGPLTSPTVRACLANVLFIGIGFGAVEVGVITFVEEHGKGRGIAGLVLAIWSLGSAVGGLTYGAMHLKAPVRRQVPVMVCLMAVGALLPIATRGILLLGAAMFAYGLTIAPFMTANSILVSASAPEGTITEAFAWHTTLIFGGAAGGTALAGALADSHSSLACLIVTGSAGCLAALSAVTGLRRASAVLT